MRIDNIPLHEIDENITIRKIEESISLNFNGTHRHNFYELLYFTYVGNESTHSIDFIESQIRTDCIYLIKPGQVYRMDLSLQKGYLIAVKAEYFNIIHPHFEHYLYFTLPDKIEMNPSDLEKVEQIIRLAYDELSEKQRAELITAYINTLTTYCALSFKDNVKKSAIDNRVLDLLSLIDINFISEREISFYTDKISLSEKRLGILTKEALGLTVKQLIQKRLLLEAKRLISYGNLPFKSIAFQLGFADASYFSRFFKTYSGQTPEQFKLSLKQS